jgi:hypothetical protein
MGWHHVTRIGRILVPALKLPPGSLKTEWQTMLMWILRRSVVSWTGSCLCGIPFFGISRAIRQSYRRARYIYIHVGLHSSLSSKLVIESDEFSRLLHVVWKIQVLMLILLNWLGFHSFELLWWKFTFCQTSRMSEQLSGSLYCVRYFASVEGGQPYHHHPNSQNCDFA